MPAARIYTSCIMPWRCDKCDTEQKCVVETLGRYGDRTRARCEDRAACCARIEDADRQAKCDEDCAVHARDCDGYCDHLTDGPRHVNACEGRVSLDGGKIIGAPELQKCPDCGESAVIEGPSGFACDPEKDGCGMQWTADEFYAEVAADV